VSASHRQEPGVDAKREGDRGVRALLWRNGGAALVRWTPYPAYRLRSTMLRLFGARVGKGVRWRRTARLDMPWQLELGDLAMVGDRVWIAGDDRVTIGARTTVSQGTTLLTSRVVHPSSPVVERGAISIGSDAWIAADAMVMPGVRIGRGSVVGARSVVQSDLQEYEVAVGHPVRTLGRRKLKSPAP
jgi:putative colanic acid biosynthesis acetyltransferase WcaF